MARHSRRISRACTAALQRGLLCAPNLHTTATHVMPPASYCRRVKRARRVVLSILFMLTLTLGWLVWPAFNEPNHRPCRADEGGGPWGYDLSSRSWTCGDNWLIRFGRFGVNGV